MAHLACPLGPIAGIGSFDDLIRESLWHQRFGELRGGGRSLSRTRLRSEIPANREINREIRQIRPPDAILKANTRANSDACSKIPYSAEQGIFAKEQGICTREQGI